MDRPPSAPPVVAVIVATEPGAWFEEALAAFGAQDYPNLSILVVDGGRAGSATRRVASVLPEAYVRRVEGGGTFASLANDALGTVQGAAFLVFAHDDVAPDPDAIRCMVEEAFRSNAGIVTPKVVEWDRPERLLDVGLFVDKTGTTAPIADRGELDQEQHDAVKDVFAANGTFLLVRSDLFAALGGFDADMGDHGADVDLCWRAQVAGGRVLVAPAARVRHRLGGREGEPLGPRELVLERRHHLRSMLRCYSLLHLLRVVPQAALITLVEVVIALWNRHIGEARSLVAAWGWNLRRVGSLRRLRRATQRSRAVPDADVRRLQVRGSVRLTTYLRRRLHAEDRAEALVEAGHRLAGALGRGPGQAAAAVLAVLSLAILLGSRDLLWGRMPNVGELAPFPGVGTLLTDYLSGWRTVGLGSSGPAPTALALLAGGGAAFLGNMDALQKLLVLGMWPLAGIGVWRLTGAFGSSLSRFVAVTAYLAMPVSYGALARGRWSGIVMWAAFPWLLGCLARLSGLAPFGTSGDDTHGVTAARARVETLKLGLLLALVAALAPSAVLVVAVAGLGLALGSALAGGFGRSVQALGGAAVAIVVAVVLHLPWSIALLQPGGWSTLTGVGPDAALAPGLGSLLRFQTGPMGAAPVGWAFLLAAALPLAIGRSWRLAWAVRLWTMSLACVLVAWAGGRGWIPLRLETPDVLLAPAALGLALAAGLGAAAFDIDLPGYRFGWRQLASLAAAGLLALGVLPVVAGVPDGRWDLTQEEVARSLAWMAPEADDGDFRVLWLGAPEALPLDGWRLSDGVAYATSRNGTPEVTDLLPGPASRATRTIASAIGLAQRGDTARLGRLLAPMAVRYIVVPLEIDTGRPDDAPRRFPVPATVTRALVTQVDLRLLPSDPGMTVYENTSWGPGRAALPDRLTGPLPTGLGAGADLSGGTPVLPEGGPVRFEGPLPAGSTVLVAEAPSSRWSLTVSGQPADRQDAFGVANAYRSTGSGPATLRFRTPPTHYGLVALQVGLWAVALRSLVRLRRRAAARPGTPREAAR